jgi:hypothetical protein
MADVELVIKIPEEAYKLLKNEGVDWLGAEHILNAVANGTPFADILGQIRAEIEKVFCMSVVTHELRTPMEVKTEILQIIDKHQAEVVPQKSEAEE